MCIKKTLFTESVVKTSHDFQKLFKQPILKTSQTINSFNILKQMFNMFYVLRHQTGSLPFHYIVFKKIFNRTIQTFTFISFIQHIISDVIFHWFESLLKSSIFSGTIVFCCFTNKFGNLCEELLLCVSNIFYVIEQYCQKYCAYTTYFLYYGIAVTSFTICIQISKNIYLSISQMTMV